MNPFNAEYGTVKYIHTQSEYRFFDINLDHDRQVRHGEKVLSAGFISYDTEHDGKKYFHLFERVSMTLKMGPIPEDGPAIAAVLGFDYRGMRK